MKEDIMVLLMGTITICSYVGYVPQIVKLIKTKTSEGISVFSWAIWLISLSCGTRLWKIFLRNY